MADVPLRDFIEAIVEQHNRRADDLREADQLSLEQYKTEMRRALDLAKSNADRVMTTLMSVMALLVSIATLIFVYFKAGH